MTFSVGHGPELGWRSWHDDDMDSDVIVVGAGLSGGLPAAAYLQKAGLRVLVVEANAEAGTFCCTHEIGRAHV